MGLIDSLKRWAAGAARQTPPARLPNETGPGLREQGVRPTPEASLEYLYRQMWVDAAYRATVLEIRDMELRDGRVKRIHARLARDIVKDGVVMTQSRERPSLRREWDAYQRRLQLHRAEKLKSDARGLVMEGNLPLQFVLDEGLQVAAAVRMPAETILPNVDSTGRFKDVREAYYQLDVMTGARIARFALWQLLVCRLDPMNFDDMGCLGRPFLDASRATWRKLGMTEEDLVIRRRTRAPLRVAHVLEGASQGDLDDYRARVEKDQGEITTDYYLNRKGGVQPVQGDANLEQIGDVVHLLDTFFAGTPLHKGLMGYTDGLARDILEDLKRDYYEEIDGLQDTLAFGYAEGFRLHLLLKGMVPDPDEYWIGFASRRTETPNQTTDRMLKWGALGLPRGMIYEELGFNPQMVKERLKEEAKDRDPYPDGAGSIGPAGADPLQGENGPGPTRVKVTPGNAPKGESATNVSSGTTHSNRLGEHWEA